MKPLKILQQTY